MAIVWSAGTPLLLLADDGDMTNSSCTATSARSYRRRRRRTAYTLAQHWRYAYRGFRRDLWTNAQGLLGCRLHSPEACWVREGVSHPPPGTECRCVRIAVLRLCLSFNVSLSLSQPQSESFLILAPSMGTVQDCITQPHEAQHRATPTTAGDGILCGNVIEVGDDGG